MKRKYSFIRLMVLSLCLVNIVSFAQESDIDLTELSLAELMQMEVSSASKSSESILEAPAVITVIPKNEIEAYGALTLQDVLDRVVGAWTYGGIAVPNGIFSLRGAVTVIDNFHILVLIDGRPTRESFRNGQYTAFYQAFPVETIERVEVIRGPGSVLYGSGAYMGVVNIITKDGGDQEATANLRIGSGDSYQFTGAVGKQYKDLEIAVGVNYLKDGGWNYTMVDENGLTGNFDYRRTAMSANMKAKYKNFRLSLFAGDNDQNAPSNRPIWLFDGDNGSDSLGVWEISTPRIFANLGYDLSISRKADITFDITHNHLDYQNKYDNIGYEDWQYGMGRSTLFEVTSFIRPNEKLNITLGGTASFQGGEFTLFYFNQDGSRHSILDNSVRPVSPFTAVPKFNSFWYSFYNQTDYQVTNFLKMVMGFQVNKVEGFDPDFVPRIGSILRFNDKMGLKLLVSSAFRAPFGLQTNVQNLGTLWGNADLKPEKNVTSEAQFIYNSKIIEGAITLYHIKQKDLVTRSLPSDSLVLIGGVSTPTFINSGTLSMDGVEVEAKVNISKSLFANLAFNYATNEDSNGKRDYQGTPNTLLKLGLSYRNERGISVGVFNTFYGNTASIATFDDQGNQVTQEVNPDPTNFSYLTANVSVDLDKLLSLKRLSGLSLNLYGTNLLNEEIWMPEYARRRVNSMPSRGDMSVYGGLKFEF